MEKRGGLMSERRIIYKERTKAVKERLIEWMNIYIFQQMN
jgi:hypothetical protein